ncbi:MAG: LemA family protein [Hominenteromicrobium sp.]
MKKKEKIKGRAAAIIGMAALILVSVPVGSCVSLTRERGKVTELYYGSDDEWGLLADLSFCSSEAANLVTLAGKYLPEGDAQVEAVREARSTLEQADTPGEKAQAFSALTDQVNALYNTLEETGMKQEDAAYRDEIIADYKADADCVSRSDYNARAAQFNEILRTTPARPLASLAGIEEVEPFR